MIKTFDKHLFISILLFLFNLKDLLKLFYRLYRNKLVLNRLQIFDQYLFKANNWHIILNKCIFFMTFLRSITSMVRVFLFQTRFETLFTVFKVILYIQYDLYNSKFEWVVFELLNFMYWKFENNCFRYYENYSNL